MLFDMGKYDLARLVRDQVDKRFTLTPEAMESLHKEIELYLEPILGKAAEYAEKENRNSILPGDVRKGVNFTAGKRVPHVLIAHASAGAGHQRAAEALAAAFKQLYPQINVKTVDTLDYINTVYKTVYGSTYLALVKYTPRLWGYIYDRYDKDVKLDDKIRQAIENLQAGDLRDLIDDFAPDVVICTHFLPMEIISRWKQKRKSSLPLYAVVTDFALHSFWIVDEIDSYFVGSDEAMRELLTRGAKARNIYVTGIPVDPIFSGLPLQSELREKLSLQKDLPTVLVMSGGYGLGDLAKLVESFQTVTTDMQLLVVTGKNEALRNELLQIARSLHIPYKIYGFVKNIHELMGASDLVITKPGGLTSSEALAAHCPMMIINPIPGQEQRNSDYLLENGAATILHNLSDGAYYVERLLKNQERLAFMTQQTRRIGKGGAALDIAQKVIELARLEV